MLKKLFAVAAISFVGFSAHAYDNKCVAAAEAAAVEEGYTDLELSAVETLHPEGRSPITGYRIWFTRPGVRGYVVANSTPECHIFDVYTHF